MEQIQIFLSVVLVQKNQSSHLKNLLQQISMQLSSIVTDHEIIIVDNASTDDSINILQALTKDDGIPNLQVYALTKEVELDIAFWAGMESSLGDFCCLVNPDSDSLSFIPEMLNSAMEGHDVVFAKNTEAQKQGFTYSLAETIFNSLFKRFNGIHLTNDAPQFRMLSKRVINFILQYPQPAQAYRHLPATAGFSKAHLEYSKKIYSGKPKSILDGIDRGMRLLSSTTQTPMRVVTTLSLFGAGANLVYSLYILLIGLFKSDVAPGWISLSLQQSGMFFLISLVLLVLGEYILNMASLSNGGPTYYVAQEFTSSRITRKERLNLEEESNTTRQN